MLVLISLSSAVYAADNCVTVFWGRGCPHCAQAKDYLNRLQDELNFTMVMYEVYYSKVNQEVFTNTSFHYESVPSGVPTIIAGDRIFIGFEDSNESIFFEKYHAWKGTSGEIRRAIKNGGHACPPTVQSKGGEFLGDPEIIRNKESTANPDASNYSPGLFERIEQKIMGYYRDESISPAERHNIKYVIFSAGLLGLGDGILNPCTLSIILFLVAYLLSVKAKDRIIPCGLSFIAGVGLVYGGFLLALLFVMQHFFLGFAGIARTALALIAGGFGLLEFREASLIGKKDAGRKLLAIPDKAMKKLNQMIKLATPVSSFVVGLFAAFAEIPCAGSFPLVFTGIVTGLPKATWLPLVLLYILLFTAPLALLVTAFRFGLSAERVENLRRRRKKGLRIFAGFVLIGFAFWFLLGGR